MDSLKIKSISKWTVKLATLNQKELATGYTYVKMYMYLSSF